VKKIASQAATEILFRMKIFLQSGGVVEQFDFPLCAFLILPNNDVIYSRSNATGVQNPAISGRKV
jgi:hypothetical protein